LTKVSGIGKKAAEKIVVELKDKMDGLGFDGESGESDSLSGDMDALEALKSLGYSERESREALKKVTDVFGAGEKVKKALKILS
jgi:Holliday junction DNA helicase RuvA